MIHMNCLYSWSLDFVGFIFLSELEKEEPEDQDIEEEIEWTEEDFVTVELVVSTGNTDEVKKVRMTWLVIALCKSRTN